ncbi:MAG TPA: anthranilate synthase component I [bacterium]|nr:anthranilate synthase component I [bacterium]HQQ01312.1 anthranilate synthase component I [bacterium]
MPVIEPSKEEFLRLARKGNLVPVTCRILADLETPVSAYMKLSEGEDHAFLLESAEQLAGRGRYSFIGLRPSQIIASKNRHITVITGDQVNKFELPETEDPLHTLRYVINRYKPAGHESLPPLCGGLVGYMGYEMIQHFEPVPFTKPDEYGMPDSVFYLADLIVAFDHQKHHTFIIACAYVEHSADAAYEEACERIRMVRERLAKPLPSERFGAGRPESPAPHFNRTKEDYMQAVGTAKEHIRAGDIFQAIVGMRADVEVEASPLDIYRALRHVNPSPYMFLIRYGNAHLIGASPEILVRLEGSKVTYRPLAGTRRRGRTADEDRALEEEMRNDPKERAEHIMLVDLGRNDIGRVCRFRTVQVTDLMNVERYSHVMHLVSNVTGELETGRDGFDLLRATFPAGTLTGSPKVRAMQIIENLEPTRRGPYGGAVGYIGFAGDLDFCITLRTILMVGQKVYFQAGAGIVADSNPEMEFNECRNKSGAMMKAVELAECSDE